MQLTPNRRLAAYLSERGHEEVYPFNQWLEKLWKDHIDSQDLLTPQELQILWEDVIQNTQEKNPLLSFAPTARMAIEAWNLCHQWEVPMNTSDWHREDHQTFLAWAREFQEICEANHWIDESRLIPPILASLSDVQLPQIIDCVGFQEWDPEQTRLLNGCQAKQNTLVKKSSLLKQKGQGFQWAASSQAEELKWAVLFAEQRLKNNPEARIGLVIPDLQHRRFEVLRILEAHFKPSQFNVSAPLALSDYPFIASALLGLSLLEKELSFENFSQFLRMPFFGRALQEMPYRAQLDVLFRDKPRPRESALEFFVSILKSLMTQLPAFADVHLINSLSDVLSYRSLIPKKRSAEEWAGLFTQILNTLQWPGERPLTSLEYQLKNRWDEILIEYTRMGRILGQQTYSRALRNVRQLCASTRFLPQSEKSPIQVLGLLEGLGLPFDDLWVMGLYREVWPKEPSPHPFIPLNLQRSLGLPHSSPKRELEVAQKMTEQFMKGAEKIIFSYPLQIEDNKTSISPLLSHLPILTAEMLWLLPKRLGVLKTIEPNLDQPLNESAPALKASETMNKGARLLKLQSICPFRAFAEIRLKAKPLGAEQQGLNPAERGEILHQILRLFWQGLDSQSALKSLTETARNQCIDDAVERVFRPWKQDQRYRLQPRYFSIEQQRAVRLVREFIALELSRPPFEVIAHEIEQSIVLSGVTLKLRIDRIDRLETGEEILIDYKTGRTSLSEWFGERPRDPQLPLYCVARNPRPQGVGFAFIRSDKIQYQGLAEKQGFLPGLLSPSQLKRYGCEESLERQQEHWQKQLSSLADEFALGRAEVSPLEGEKTCRGCHLRSLCRVVPNPL